MPTKFDWLNWVDHAVRGVNAPVTDDNFNVSTGRPDTPEGISPVRPAPVDVSAPPVRLDTPTPANVGLSDFTPNFNVASPAETLGLPAPTIGGAPPPLLTAPKSELIPSATPTPAGLTENLPAILGMLAQAIGPDTAGGRIGKGVLGLTELDKEAEAASQTAALEREKVGISRLGAESLAGTRAATQARTGAELGLKLGTGERAADEVTRISDLGRLNSEFRQLTPGPPGSPEQAAYMSKLTEIRAIAKPSELSSLGLAPQPELRTVNVGTSEKPDWQLRQVTGTEPLGTFGAPTPPSESTDFTLEKVYDPISNKMVFAQRQTGGPGVGDITVTDIQPQPDVPERQRIDAINSLIEQNKKLGPNAQIPITERAIAKESAILNPKGGKKSTFPRKPGVPTTDVGLSGEGAKLAATLPKGTGQVIDPETVKAYKAAANGDMALARKLALANNWRLK